MAQLYFRYSTMNAGKSIDVLKVAYNYEEKGKRVLLLTPAADTRFGKGLISSRIGIQKEAVVVEDDMDLFSYFCEENQNGMIDCVIVDEAQFLRAHHAKELAKIVDLFNVPVLTYGLKNDFRNELFEGSYYLLVYADKIEEIKTICWCGRKATMTARVVDGKIIKEGAQIAVGGNDMYVSLCRKHYTECCLKPSYSGPSYRI